jgi:hypothetical protein
LRFELLEPVLHQVRHLFRRKLARLLRSFVQRPDLLMWALRDSTPKRSTWLVAQFATLRLRLRLIKIAVRSVDVKTTNRAHLPTSCPRNRSFASSMGAYRVS